jgi:hypothetical protein
MARTNLLLADIQHLIHSASKRQPTPERAITVIYAAVNQLIPSSHSHRSLAGALLGLVFNRVIELIGLGQYPPAYVEMHALLEELAVKLLPKRVGSKNQQAIIFDLLKRKTLSDIAPYYVELGHWTKEDASFVKSLAAVRNGVAHQNFSLLAKHLPQDNAQRGLDSFQFDLQKTADALARVINLMIKISRPNKRKPRKLKGSD